MNLNFSFKKVYVHTVWHLVGFFLQFDSYANNYATLHENVASSIFAGNDVF